MRDNISGHNIISIHAPTRGATFPELSVAVKSIVISIHAPTRGATSTCFFVSSAPNFNPRSHERSDVDRHTIDNFLKISIHAPTRGATMLQNHRGQNRSISIHAPTRGATRCRYRKKNIYKFQSTLPREERRTGGELSKAVHTISIHAPTRGATAILHKKFVYFYTIPTINI